MPGQRLNLGILYFNRKRFKDALKYLEHPKLKGDASASLNCYLGMTLLLSVLNI